MVVQKKKGWFFNKNIIDEINSVPEEKIEKREPPKAAPTLKVIPDNTLNAPQDKQGAKIEEHKTVISQQKDEEVQRLEKQIKDLLAEINKKEEQYSPLKQVILEKNQTIEQMLEEQRDQINEKQVEEVSELKEQLAQLKTENTELKQEAVAAKLEIGEVLILARKQANRMVEKSKMDAHRIVEEAQKELALINQQAKEISDEVSESRHVVMALYEEMQTRVEILAQEAVKNDSEN